MISTLKKAFASADLDAVNARVKGVAISAKARAAEAYDSAAERVSGYYDTATDAMVERMGLPDRMFARGVQAALIEVKEAMGRGELTTDTLDAIEKELIDALDQDGDLDDTE